MCSMSVLCPLCAVPSFGSLEQLQQCLIKAANGPLSCPFAQCQEQFLGLDKLTIHLFSHTSLMTSNDKSTTAATTTTKTTAAAEAKGNSNNNTNESATTSAAANATAQQQPTQATASKRKAKKVKQQKPPAKETAHDALAEDVVTTEQVPAEPTNVTPSPSSDTATTATCDICEFTFRNEDLRDMHCRLVHENLESTPPPRTATNEPFKCHLCAKTFKMKGSLRVHLKVVHLIGLSYVNNTPKLNICDRIRHREARSPPSATATATTTTAINHLQPTSTLVQQSALSTTPCGITDAFTGTLTLLTSSGATDLVTRTASVLNINANGELVQPSGGAASNVLLVFNASVPAVAAVGAANESSPESKYAADVNPKIWECDVCLKSFTTKYFLKKHKRLHTGEMPYTCEICARTFTFQQSYHKHLLYHSEVKPHVCAICGRAFKELSTLHNHERIHSGEKPFKCEVCGKCFRQRVSFLVHSRIHTGSMPYKCDVCQKSFRYKVSQRTHKCVQTLTTGGYNGAATAAAVEANIEPTSCASESGVEQLSESFIKAFLESNAASSNSLSPLAEAQHSPASAEIAAITDDIADADSKCAMDQALLSKTIDDIVIESCQKLGIDFGNDLTRTPAAAVSSSAERSAATTTAESYDGTCSPLQQLQRLRLYSPQLTPLERTDSNVLFEQFLMNDSGGHLLP